MPVQVGNVLFSISADISKLQGQLRTMESSFQSSFSRVESLGRGVAGALGIGLSVGAIVAFGKQVIELGGHLQDLSQQTGVSVETLSGIKSVLEENGTSVDAFAQGVFNLQKNLGGINNSTDPAAKAIQALGLSLDDLRNSSPDEFVKKVTDALAKVENPTQRNTLAFNLLGKSAKELIPAFLELAGNFDELRAKGLNADTVKRLDEIGDAMTRLRNTALLLGGDMLVSLSKLFGLIEASPLESLVLLLIKLRALRSKLRISTKVWIRGAWRA
jgi:uncharacterized protein YoxC